MTKIYHGSTRLEQSIEDSEHIIIVDGHLTINGNIGSNVTIEFQTTRPEFFPQTYIDDKRVPDYDLNIEGNVTSNAIFKCGGAIKISGNVGPHSSLKAIKSVEAGDVGNHSHISTIEEILKLNKISHHVHLENVNGDISFSEAEDNNTIETVNGSVNFSRAGDNTTIKTVNGSINGQAVGNFASFSTINGSITCPNFGENAKLKSLNGLINNTVQSTEKQQTNTFYIAKKKPSFWDCCSFSPEKTKVKKKVTFHHFPVYKPR